MDLRETEGSEKFKNNILRDIRRTLALNKCRLLFIKKEKES